MADNSNTVQITLQVKDDGSVVIDQVRGKIESLGKSAGAATSFFDKLKNNWVALAGAGAAVLGAAKTVESFANAAGEAEQIESRMAFQLSTLGYQFESIKPFVDDFATSIMKTTRFSDEMARQGLGQMMQYTADVEKGMNGLRLAMDMSTQTGQDLGSTVRFVGMAMNGNAEILGRWIPELRGLDEKLGSSATQAEKAAYAIEVLTKKFGGSAEKDLETYAGKLERAKNLFGELQESAGNVLLPILSKSMEGWTLIFNKISGAGQSESLETMIARQKSEYEAWRRAQEQARVAVAAREADERLIKEKKLREDQIKIDQDYQIRYLALSGDRVAASQVERDKILQEAWQKGLRLTEIEKYFNALILEEEKKKTQQIRDYNKSLKEEALNIMGGLGIKTEAGAQEEITRLLTQYQRLSDSGMFSKEQLDSARALIEERLRQVGQSYSNFFGQIEEEFRDEEDELKVKWTRLVPKDAFTRNVESMISEAINELGRMEKATEQPFKMAVDFTDLKRAEEAVISLENRLNDLMRQQWQVNLAITGTGSTQRPIMDKIEEIYGGFSGMEEAIAGMKFNLNLTDLNQKIGTLKMKIWEAETSNSPYGYMPGVFQELKAAPYRSALTSAQQERDLLISAQNAMQARQPMPTGSSSGYSGSGIQINVGQINITGVGEGIAEEIDKKLADLWTHNRSQLRSAIEG